MDVTTIFSDLNGLMADITLACGILVLLVVGVFLTVRAMQRVAIGGVVLLFVTMLITLLEDQGGTVTMLFGDMIIHDRFGVFMKLLVFVASIAAIMMVVRDLGAHVIGRFEYVILMLLATLGMSIMISSANLLTLYVGLELQSLSLYILAASNRNSLHSSEAGLKYFILGALSSGMLLFGISLVYGYTGTTGYATIAETLAAQDGGISMAIVMGLVFILVGIAFKISAVPFHMWTPDVYQGAPASIVAFFALAPKVAAFALLIRVLYMAFLDAQAEWTQIICVLSALSMIVGAFAGLVQKNIRRLLAYSSIGHMGYALLAVVAGGVDGISSGLVYMVIYVVMTGGLFAMVLSLRKDEVSVEEIEDLAGLSNKSPLTAYGMAILLFSMGGIPPMAGFFGKLLVFKAALASGYVILAVIGVLTSVVAAYYYLYIIKVMFFDKASSSVEGYQAAHSHLLGWISVPSLIFTVAYILMPDWLIYEAQQAAAVLY